MPSSLQESQSFNFGPAFGGVAGSAFGQFGPGFGAFGPGFGVRNFGGVGIAAPAAVGVGIAGVPVAGAVVDAVPAVAAVPAVPVAPAVAAGPVGPGVTSSYFSLGAPAVAAAIPAVPAVRAFPAVPAVPALPAAGPLAYGADYATPTPYNYGYGVSDPVTGSNFGANEESDGVGNTAGEYRVLLPDGRTQIVSYSVNGPSGFVANVRYEGVAAVAPVGPAYRPY